MFCWTRLYLPYCPTITVTFNLRSLAKILQPLLVPNNLQPWETVTICDKRVSLETSSVHRFPSIWFPISYMINLKQSSVSHGFCDIKIQCYWGHDLDLLGSREVIGHVSWRNHWIPNMRFPIGIVNLNIFAVVGHCCTYLPTPFPPIQYMVLYPRLVVGILSVPFIVSEI